MVLRKAVCREGRYAPTGSFASKAPAQENARDLSLHEAVRKKNLRLVKKAAEKAKSVNEPDENGRTPLMVAAEVNCNVIANYLLSKGASMNLRDNAGKNAIEIASSNRSWGVVALFDHVRGWHTLD